MCSPWAALPGVRSQPATCTPTSGPAERRRPALRPCRLEQLTRSRHRQLLVGHGVQSRGGSGRGRCGLRVGLLVQLDDAHGALGRGLDAQVAEHALVEVLLDDAQGAIVAAGRRCRPGRPRSSLRAISASAATDSSTSTSMKIARAGAVLIAPPSAPSRSLTRSGISAISSATAMPASCRRAIFSAAVSALPSTIVPAWPKLMPGISSMNLPAMKATIGSREFGLGHVAARAPPPCGRRARSRSRSPASARRPRTAASAPCRSSR